MTSSDLTAAQVAHPASEVWTSGPVTIAGDYHIRIEYDQMLLVRYFTAGETLNRDAMEVQRSILPVPSAEEHHALLAQVERLQKRVEELEARVEGMVMP